jgi:hypothetical protein
MPESNYNHANDIKNAINVLRVKIDHQKNIILSEEGKKNTIKEDFKRFNRAAQVIQLLENQLKLDEAQDKLAYELEKERYSREIEEPLSRAMNDFNKAKKISDSIFGVISDVLIHSIKDISSYFGFHIQTNKEVTVLKLQALLKLQSSPLNCTLRSPPDYKIEERINFYKKENKDNIERAQEQYVDVELNLSFLRKRLTVLELNHSFLCDKLTALQCNAQLKHDNQPEFNYIGCSVS